MYYLLRCRLLDLHFSYIYIFLSFFIFFFFNDTSPTEIYTLSLHDALPICINALAVAELNSIESADGAENFWMVLVEEEGESGPRSEEHTSELQSLRHLVCRLLLEKKKKKKKK